MKLKLLFLNLKNKGEWGMVNGAKVRGWGDKGMGRWGDGDIGSVGSVGSVGRKRIYTSPSSHTSLYSHTSPSPHLPISPSPHLPIPLIPATS